VAAYAYFALARPGPADIDIRHQAGGASHHAMAAIR